jgi:cytochrome c-type biogenesis protein CcmF
MTIAGFGQFILVLAAILCSFAILADILAAWKKNTMLAACGRYATIGVLVCLTSAVITLLVLLLNDDFTADYVAQHSSRRLPVLYKISAFWAGSEGALLLWLWLQVGFVSVVFFKNRPDALAFSSRGRSIANFVSAFFLQALIHDRQPFATLAVTPGDGIAGSESLVNPAIVLSLPFFFVGFAALIIPFAWSFGFFKSDPDTHVKTMLSGARGWSLCAWGFLTVGIVLGVWGRYMEFGASSGQMWDSVFNLPLITWFFAMLMVVCYRVYRSRASFGVLASMMSIFTYTLCVYGVFLTRFVYNYNAVDSADVAHGRFFVVLLIHIWAIAAMMLLRGHFRKNKSLEIKVNQDY